MKRIIVTLVFILIMSGCSGKQCLKIDGTYDGITGGLEYCFDAQEEGYAKFVDNQGKTAYMIPETDLEKIASKEVSESSVKSIEKPILRFKKLLK